MKKLLVLSIFLLILAFSCNLSNAEDDISEEPDIKIVINGKETTYDDVPLIVNGRTLLPLRAVLVNLGVKDDDDHIIWNSSERSVTINKDLTSIYLKVGSDTAYINNTAVELDAAPLCYKNNRTYIPARFVSQALGKKVVWDGITKTVLIRDENEYSSIKNIIDRCNESMKSVEKMKTGTEINMIMSKQDFDLNYNVNMTNDIDMMNKKMRLNMQMLLLKDTPLVEYYYADNIEYCRDPFTGKIEKRQMKENEFNGVIDESTSLTSINSIDVLCAVLEETESENSDEILLKGDVYPKELSDLIRKNSGAEIYKSDRYYIEVTIDKNTYRLVKINMNMSGKIKVEKGDLGVKSQVTCTYSDYNGDFDVLAPGWVKVELE